MTFLTEIRQSGVEDQAAGRVYSAVVRSVCMPPQPDRVMRERDDALVLLPHPSTGLP
ncbi:MAG: hypothetical protein KatS3mg043_0656 [Rhodothermaceae bacterium]|nr:MAG: hypothetical protein KatS3mg043_0656 [Rhodothermaceae bacterium]